MYLQQCFVVLSLGWCDYGLLFVALDFDCWLAFAISFWLIVAFWLVC